MRAAVCFALVALTLAACHRSAAQDAGTPPPSFDPADLDEAGRAQYELFKSGKVNRRKMLMRLTDNPTKAMAGEDGYWDPFRDGEVTETTVETPGTTTTTTTAALEGPNFRAYAKRTVTRTKAFGDVENMKKRGKDNMDGWLQKNNLTGDMTHSWYGAQSGITVVDVEDESKAEELWMKLKAMEGAGEIDFVELDVLFEAFQTDLNCRPRDDWGFQQTRTPQALELLGSSDMDDSAEVLVAVVDSGVDYTHPALADRVFVNEAELFGEDGVDDDLNGFVDDIRGWNFFDNNNATMDLNGHGSHVAGILAATPDPLGRVDQQGIAPNARILPCRFTGEDRAGSVSDAVRCFEYAWLMGAELTSNSWGAPLAFTRSLEQVLNDAERAGILAVFAAGNEGMDNDGDFQQQTLPASLPSPIIISVAAIDFNGRRVPQSNFGEENVDIAAPGASILSTSTGGRYVYMSGTSMATPFVTGGAALLLGACKQQGVRCSATAIKQALLDGVEVTGALDGEVLSDGHLDVSRAVQLMGLDSNASALAQADLCSGAPPRVSASHLALVAALALLVLCWLF